MNINRKMERQREQAMTKAVGQYKRLVRDIGVPGILEMTYGFCNARMRSEALKKELKTELEKAYTIIEMDADYVEEEEVA